MSDPLGSLVQVGAVGAILAWFLIRLEPRLHQMERSIDRFSRVMLLDVLSRPQVPAAVKRQAEGILTDMDHERRRREDD